MTVGRNQPCPCGSGKKYKKCCAAKRVSKYVRTEGGDADEGRRGFRPHRGRLPCHCPFLGECSGRRRAGGMAVREHSLRKMAAMAFYKANIRPPLEQLMAQASQKSSGFGFLHRKLE